MTRVTAAEAQHPVWRPRSRPRAGAEPEGDEEATRAEGATHYGPADEKELDADQLVRGYELDDGKVVVVSDEELEALAPKKGREIDLRLFVDRDGIDPLYFERSYFLAPGEGSGKAHRLLVAVMEESQRATQEGGTQLAREGERHAEASGERVSRRAST